MPVKMTKAESGTRAVLAYYGALNAGDIAALETLLAAQCVFRADLPGFWRGEIVGRGAVLAFWRSAFSQWQEAHFELMEVFGMGFRCVARWVLTWQDATGQMGKCIGVDIFRLQAGKISEILEYHQGD